MKNLRLFKVLLKRNISKNQIRNADLSGVNLRIAYLRNAYLRNADLSGAILRNANLRNADLSGAILTGADLTGADLSGVNLSGAKLSGADLRNANLSGAILTGADLSELIYNELTSFLAIQCPEEGSFIAYKKAQGKVVKLQITENALRSSATSRKCRASEAKVLEILDSDLTFAGSSRDSNFLYIVGEIVKVDNFDTNRWNECSTGIHFFLTKREAELYN